MSAWIQDGATLFAGVELQKQHKAKIALYTVSQKNGSQSNGLQWFQGYANLLPMTLSIYNVN